MIALGWVCALLALLPLAMTLVNLRRFVPPTALPDPATGVSILIPARNEAPGIEVALRAALASTGVRIEVVVLDDDSRDGTGAIVARLAAADARLRLVTAPTLPTGWAGKQRACHLLSQAARMEVLMFVDADVFLAPEAAAHATGALLAPDTPGARGEAAGRVVPRLGLVSGFPRELTVGVAEHLVIPWIHVLLLGYLPMDKMRASASPAYAAACGQWIVARRDAYLEAGGHAATPESRHDGLSLPRALRVAGWRTDVFDGGRLAQCRMYTDFVTVWRGFGKSAGEGMATPRALPVWTVLVGGGHVLPWLLLIAGMLRAESALALAGGVGVAANLALRLLLCQRLHQPLLGAWLHPAGAVLVLAIQWSALARHLLGRPSEWRGRRYSRRVATARRRTS